MKKLIKIAISFSLIFTILLTNIKASVNDVTVLFTHDMHDNFEPFNIELDNKVVERGGFARLYSAILKEREIDNEALLIDGGDYSQGTLFQSIFATHAPSLRLMGMMGYDATVLGNHEFDFRTQGLANHLNSALSSGDDLVDILSSNTNYDVENKSDGLNQLKKAVEEYGVKDYKIVEKNGVKIGMFGLMGYEADSNAPMAEVEFLDYIEEAKRVTKLLKAENVDMIVALSHSGTSSNPKQSEDEILAKEVGDIDVILSAHSHTLLEEPIVINNTTIVSAGRYGQNLGKLVVENTGERWKVKDYQIIPIDKSFEENEEVKNKVEEFKLAVNDEYLAKYGLGFNDILANSPFSFTPASMLTSGFEEEPIAHLIGDAYINSIKEIEKDDYIPVDVAVVPSGVLRDSIVEGNLTVSDIFNILPLGVGKDEISGYPILSVYLSGKELKLAAEIDASISPILSFAKLYLTGMSYTFNPNRIILNKVTDVNLWDGIDTNTEIEDDKLYRVVADLYTAQMLGVVNDQSFGLLSIVPKDINGNPVTDFEDHIVYNNNDEELKMWISLSDYLKSFDKNEEDISVIPSKYDGKQGYKTIEDNNKLSAKFTNLNVFSISIISIVTVILLALILLVVFIVRKIRKRRAVKYSHTNESYRPYI